MDFKAAIENTKELYLSKSSLETVLDFERVLDELNLYVFRNWKSGELVQGPIYEKYWITCVFMWPKSMMPDPAGAMKLHDYDCKITYQMDTFISPVKVKTAQDFRPGAKKPKLRKDPVWIVTIKMPRNLISDIELGYAEIQGQHVDLDDMDKAYEEGIDQEIVADDPLENEQDNEQDINDISI
tara:strand:- start:362 stop:910 length:549 start_codon:yes stop_codon:yes gene_type:complete